MSDFLSPEFLNSPAGKVLWTIAMELAKSLIKNIDNQLKAKGFEASQTQALQRAYQQAFFAMLASCSEDLTEAELHHFSTIFFDFLNAPGISDQFFNLSLNGQEPNLPDMHNKFDNLPDYDRSSLSIDFDTAIQSFIDVLLPALIVEVKNSAKSLETTINLSLLYRLVRNSERLGGQGFLTK